MSSLSTNVGWSEERSNNLIERIKPYVSGDDPAHLLSKTSAVDECLGQSIRQSIEITLDNKDYQMPACNTPFEETSDNESIGIKIIGHKGDFITAPEINQIFGELITICLIKQWETFGKPNDFNLIEFGPGKGTLMLDILRTSNSFNFF